MTPQDTHREDPRRERSRSRLLDAATALLTSGGVEAVTIDAVTRASKVARTTLYRHFDGSAAVITAAFERLLPPITEPPSDGSVRDRLTALLDRIADSIDGAPLHLTVFGWLALGSGREDRTGRAGAAEDDADLQDAEPEPDDGTASLQQRVIAQYRVPFDAVLDSPDVRARIGAYDNTLAMLQLTGPLVFARLAGLPAVDRAQRARIVDDFLAARAAGTGGAPIIEIRAERPGDVEAIRRVTQAAFDGAEHGGTGNSGTGNSGTGNSGTERTSGAEAVVEARIVDTLREAGALAVSLVAVRGDETVGHIAFSPVTVDGRDVGWYGLGPVSVRPDQQGIGIGGALVRRGLENLRDLDARGCVLLGDPAYYGRFGFRPDPALRYPGAPAEYFQALRLSGGAPGGEVAYHRAFGDPSGAG